MDRAEFLQNILSGRAGQLVSASSIENDTIILSTEPAKLIALMQELRDNQQLSLRQLIDVTAVDYPEREGRFEVIYQLLSLRHNLRVTVKTSVAPGVSIPTMCSLFGSADWLEREVYDMYGVVFKGHPDLRRILTDYGFEGHPQRKDFPLTGHVEIRYDEEKGRVVYEPVKLHQEFRMFDYLSPWEGAEYVLPGDEKAEKK